MRVNEGLSWNTQCTSIIKAIQPSALHNKNQMGRMEDRWLYEVETWTEKSSGVGQRSRDIISHETLRKRTKGIRNANWGLLGRKLHMQLYAFHKWLYKWFLVWLISSGNTLKKMNPTSKPQVPHCTYSRIENPSLALCQHFSCHLKWNLSLVHFKIRPFNNWANFNSTNVQKENVIHAKFYFYAYFYIEKKLKGI